MKWMTVLVLSLVFGCGGKKEEDKIAKVEKDETKEEGGGWSSKLDGLADKAKEVGKDIGDKARDVGDKAKEVGSDVADTAKDVGDKAATKARELEIEKHAREIGDAVARKAEGLSKEALELGKDLKSKIAAGSKLAKYNYDLSVDAQPEDEAAFKARHAKMKQLEVGDYKVGFERRSTHPLGKVYKWQFMIGWRLPDGRSVRLSIFTDDELEELVLAAMMGELLPLTNSLLK